MNCPQCDERLEQKVSFCPHCGYDLRNYLSVMEPEAPAPVAATGEAPARPAISHPLYVQAKAHVIYAVAACFLYTLFSVMTIRGGSENRRRTRGTEITVPVSGINLLFGSFPNFRVKEFDDDEVTVTTKAMALKKLEPRESRLVKTPWLFRTGYWVLTLGVILLALVHFQYKDHDRMAAVAKACGLLGSFAVMWVAGNFNRLGDRFGGFMGEFHLSAGCSIGLWGLLLCFVFLFLETLAATFRLPTPHSATPQTPAL